MSFVDIAIGAVAVSAIGTGAAVINANKAANAQRAAAQRQQQADATAQASDEAAAANEANSLRVSQRRAFAANSLALGGSGDDTLGAPGPNGGGVLVTGAQAGRTNPGSSGVLGSGSGVGGLSGGVGGIGGGGYNGKFTRALN